MISFGVEKPRNVIAFWILGLINNSSYVIMNAGASEISNGAVALVYISNIIPTLIVKASAPYWFDRVSYQARIAACTVFMTASFLLVSFSNSLAMALLGVACASVQSGMGESTILALSSKFVDRKMMLTSWSSGTGFAGVFGYGWIALFHILGGLSFTVTILLANVLGAIFFATFFKMLEIPEKRDSLGENLIHPVSQSEEDNKKYETGINQGVIGNSNEESEESSSSQNLTTRERAKLILSLWPYTFPLFLVYISEYILQAGVWSAMGFPVTSKDARVEFYTFSNMAYQVGVFFSRTSGVIWNPDVTILWLMPIFQCFLLIFFSFDAVHQFWYDHSVLVLCFVSGFFGGAVYVNAYKHISSNTPSNQRELALAGASLADTLGIAFASLISLFVQSCLFDKNNLTGGTFEGVC
eukprot:c16787_g1_i1.p1 GENE.c16787_g1_i1~~c16787_g1_i1.p1  ORF type:complete len:424 (+),score=180.03 c16787_g1_i1:34-1272(+)